MSVLIEMMPTNVIFIFMAVLAILGVLWCYFGFKFYKAMVGVNGFFFGVIFSSEILTEIFQYLEIDSTGSFVFMAIACIGVGILFCYLSVRFYFLGLFLIGALAGYFLPAIFTELSGLSCLGISIVIGILMGFMGKYLIIFASAILGGILLAECSCFAIRSMLTGTGKDIVLISLSIVFIFTGIIVQLKSKNKQKHLDSDVSKVKDESADLKEELK